MRFLRLFFLVAAIAVAQQNAQAVNPRGGEHSGGGDKDGIATAAVLKKLPRVLTTYAKDLVSADTLSELVNTASSTSTLIMMQEQKPTADAAGFTQNSSAFSSTGSRFDVIAIYRKDWTDTSNDEALQLALLTHEICILKGIETTGAYGAVSAEILNRLRKYGVPADSTADLTISCELQAFDHGKRAGDWKYSAMINNILVKPDKDGSIHVNQLTGLSTAPLTLFDVEVARSQRRDNNYFHHYIADTRAGCDSDGNCIFAVDVSFTILDKNHAIAKIPLDWGNNVYSVRINPSAPNSSTKVDVEQGYSLAINCKMVNK